MGKQRGATDAAKVRFLRAVRSLAEAIEFAQSASCFFSKANFAALGDWAEHQSAPAEQRLADLEGTLRLIGLDPGE